MKVPLSYTVALLLAKDNEISPFLVTSDASAELLPTRVSSDGKIRSGSRLSPRSHSSSINPSNSLTTFQGKQSFLSNISCGGGRRGAPRQQSKQPRRQAPALLRPWIYMYNLVPKIVMPCTNLNVGFTLFSALLFTCIDFAIAHVLYQLGWPRGSSTRAVAGSITTILHSTSLVICLVACLASYRCTPSAKLSEAPQWWQDAAHAAIEWCTGYMLYDAVVQFILDNWESGKGPVLSQADWMFLGHHAATSIYMTSARLLQAGHGSAMILMAGGEVTAPFQNVMRISRIMMQENIGSGRLHPHIQYVWAVLYAFFRIVVGPACAVYLTQDLIFTQEGRQRVPPGLSILWLTMCWAVLFGSIPWIKGALGIIGQGVS